MTVQLTFDALPEWRTRDGVWPLEAHQRGWVRLGYDAVSLGKVGDFVPAWVCCRCGGIELGAYVLELNHGCCVHWRGIHGSCTRMSYYQPPWRPSPVWLAVRPP